jgi:serine/threonine-protein kinase
VVVVAAAGEHHRANGGSARRLLLSRKLQEERQAGEVARSVLPALQALAACPPGGDCPAGRAATALVPWLPPLGLATGPNLARFRELARQVDHNKAPRLEVLALARSLRLAGEDGAAEGLLRAAVTRWPNEVVYLVELGRLLAQQEPARLAEAIECYRAARARRPDLGIALGLALGRAGRAAEGEAVVRELLRQQPRNPELHFSLGNALVDQGKPAEAEAAFRRAVALDPRFAQAHNNLGIVLKDKGQIDEAIRLYRRALALAPRLPQAHNNLGLALKAKGQLDEAIKLYRQAISLDPKLAGAHLNLGIALRAKGQVDEAIRHYRRAIERDRSHAASHVGLGNALKAKGQSGEAIKLYRRAIDLQPADPLAHLNLGIALVQQAQFTEALAALKRGSGLLPGKDPRRNQVQQLVQFCERLLTLDARLPAIMEGRETPASTAEQIDFAQLCVLKKLYVAAARLYRDAFVADPKGLEAVPLPTRYHAARAAALAGCGQGNDGGKLDDEARARWRRQALDWLRADLAGWAKALDNGKPGGKGAVQQGLRRWQADADLAGVREPAALAKLPEAEREHWQRLWADVAALRKRAEPSRAQTPSREGAPP